MCWVLMKASRGSSSSAFGLRATTCRLSRKRAQAPRIEQCWVQRTAKVVSWSRRMGILVSCCLSTPRGSAHRLGGAGSVVECGGSGVGRGGHSATCEPAHRQSDCNRADARSRPPPSALTLRPAGALDRRPADSRSGGGPITLPRHRLAPARARIRPRRASTSLRSDAMKGIPNARAINRHRPAAPAALG